MENLTSINSTSIKHVTKKDGLPFEVSSSQPSKELLKALEEGDKMIKDLESGKRKGYHNVKQMFENILNKD